MSQQGHEPEILTASDLAALCQVPVGTIYAWNYRGTGPTLLRLGKHVRYRRRDVEAWLRLQEEGGEHAA